MNNKGQKGNEPRLKTCRQLLGLCNCIQAILFPNQLIDKFLIKIDIYTLIKYNQYTHHIIKPYQNDYYKHTSKQNYNIDKYYNSLITTFSVVNCPRHIPS